MTAGRGIMWIDSLQWIDPFTLHIGIIYASFLWCHLLFRSQLVMVCINRGVLCVLAEEGILFGKVPMNAELSIRVQEIICKEHNIYFLNNWNSSFSRGFVEEDILFTSVQTNRHDKKRLGQNIYSSCLVLFAKGKDGILKYIKQCLFYRPHYGSFDKPNVNILIYKIQWSKY